MTRIRPFFDLTAIMKKNGSMFFFQSEKAVQALRSKLSILILSLIDSRIGPSIKTIGQQMKKPRPILPDSAPHDYQKAVDIAGEVDSIIKRPPGIKNPKDHFMKVSHYLKASTPVKAIIMPKTNSKMDRSTPGKKHPASFFATLSALGKGGKVPGRSAHPRADNILARLTAGEWVIQKPSVEYYGAHILNAINKRLIDKNMLLNAAANSFRQNIRQTMPEAMNTVRKTMTTPASLPSFAYGGAVSSGSPFPDYGYLRYLNAMDELAMQNEKIAAKAADAAKMQELAAERWGGIMGQMSNAGFGAGLTGAGTVNISLNGTTLNDSEFEKQLTRVLKRAQSRR